MENYNIDNAVVEIGEIALKGVPKSSGYIFYASDVRVVLNKLTESVLAEVRANIIADYVVDTVDWDAAEEYADQILGDLNGHD